MTLANQTGTNLKTPAHRSGRRRPIAGLTQSSPASDHHGRPTVKTSPAKQRRPVLSLFVSLLAALSAAMAFASGPAFAAAGDLDPSFDGDGRLVLPFAAQPGDVLVQPDGKIVVTDSASFTVMRLNPDGSLDRGFGGDGVVSADLSGGAGIESAALQPDGKIVVAGQTASFAIAVARFTASGSLDATFDPGGPDGDGQRVYTGLQPSSPAATLVQPDGRIVLVGASGVGITASRLTSSGAPDGTTFEYAGDDNSDFVHAAALAPDGKIVAAGDSATSGSTDRDSVVARFSADGSVDKSFAGTGLTELGPANRDDIARAVLVQPNGKIVLAEESGTGTKQMVVTRLNTDGAPDTTFAGDGTAKPDFVGQSYPAGVALQADGKILVAGSLQPAYQIAVARLDARGSLDPSFGLDGKTTIQFDGIAAASAAALQPDGRFVIAGVTAVANNTSIRTALARVLTDQPPGGGRPGGDGPDGGDPGAGPGVDRDAPVIGPVTLTPATFAVARHSTAAAAARGTTIRYTLSEPATVTLRFRRATVGRRVGHACRPITARSRKRRPCRRYVAAGTLRRAGRPGPNRVAFSGRIGRRALQPATYRLIVRGVDAAGNRATSRPRAFRIVG
jgi:uncharacterized delta-60 repeat protein